MAKLSGFLLSALLAVLCLWLNMTSYPRAASATSQTDANGAAVENHENVENSKRSAVSLADAKDAFEVDAKSANERQDSAKSQDSNSTETDENDAASGDEEAPTTASLHWEVGGFVRNANLTEGALDDLRVSQTALRFSSKASAQDEPVKTSVKPQGGKYVSIPPVETDALDVNTDLDDRVIGAVRAEAKERFNL